MVTKSNIYHYFSYVIFALVFFCSIGLYSVSIVKAEGSTDYLIPLVMRYGIVILAIAILILGYRTIFKYLPEKFKIITIPNVSRLIEILILIVTGILFFLSRLVYIVSLIGTEITSEYLDFATGNQEALTNNSMLGYLYGYICKLLTNIHPSAYPIFVFNAIIQFAIAVITYYTIKQAIRMRYAIVSLLLLSFLPVFFDLTIKITPDTIYGLIISLYVFALVKICHANKNNKIDGNISVLIFIFLGIFAGIISVLDIFGIVIVLITIPSLALIVNPDPWLKIQKSWFQIIVYLLSTLAGGFAFLYIVNLNGLTNFDNIMNYVYSFVPSGLNVDIIAPMAARQEGIAIIIFAGVAIFAFLRNDLDKGLYYVLFIDIASIMTFVSFNNITYDYIVNYSWTMLAIIGLFSLPSFVLTQEEIEQANQKTKEKNKIKSQKEKEKFLANNDGSLISLSNDVNNNVNNKENEKVIKNEKSVKAEKTKSVKEEKKKNKNNNVSISENNVSLTYDVNIENKKEPTSVVIEQPVKPVQVETEVTKPITLEPVKVETVYAEEVDKRKIIPSRKEYKTAHVYKSEEDKLKHDEAVKAPIVNQNADLKDKPAMIKNVLPTPKPHVSKEMNFDFDIKDSDLDYDITDLKGQDYYDI